MKARIPQLALVWDVMFRTSCWYLNFLIFKIAIVVLIFLWEYNSLWAVGLGVLNLSITVALYIDLFHSLGQTGRNSSWQSTAKLTGDPKQILKATHWLLLTPPYSRVLSLWWHKQTEWIRHMDFKSRVWDYSGSQEQSRVITTPTYETRHFPLVLGSATSPFTHRTHRTHRVWGSVPSMS